MLPAVVSDGSPDVLGLISNGMSATLHWFPEDVSLTLLATTLVGMANSVGGTVIIGVSPRAGELIGVNNTQAAFERIFQTALLSDPILVLPMAQKVEIQRIGKAKPVSLILITVPAGLPHVYSLDGRYIGRDGHHNSPLPPRLLYKLLTERDAIQFESRLVAEAGLEDLDSDAILSYAHTVGNITPVNLEKALDFLVKRGCLKRVDDSLKLTYASLLLFGSHPQQWLPNATILAGRFPGVAMSDTYVKRDIYGNLPAQLAQAEEFIRANLNTVVRMAGLTRQETLEYPFEAVRELLVNAVAHRDYNLQGDNIHLNVYADRLVVTSPGTLSGPVTLENLLEARFARNAIISQVLSDLGYVERLGYGLDRVLDATRNEGLLPPQFEEIAGTFRVTLFGRQSGATKEGRLPDLSEYFSQDLNSRQQLAVTQLVKLQRITSHDYQQLCPDVHTETLRRDLVDLVKRGFLIKVGDKKSTYYILKKV